MTQYSYAQLEGLWINAGGPRNLAPIMAAIAEAESGGNSNARNPSGATGLWQILGAVNPADQANLTNPQVNAREAVLKWKTQGLQAWTTYTSGAYRGFLNTSTTPAGVSGGKGGGTGTPATLTAAQQQASAACIVGFGIGPSGSSWIQGLWNALPIVGGQPTGSLPSGTICLFSKTNARALIGGLMLAAGGLTTFTGLAVLVAGAFSGTGAGKVAGRATEAIGAGVGIIPGGEAAGAAIIAAGHGEVKYSQHVQQRRQAKKQAGAREDAAREKQLGQPRENPNLETRGGTVRESDLDRQRRKRREAERTRKSVSPGGKPASRAEAGF